METATQLEDSRPQIDTPLRVKAPANVPKRTERLSRDDYIKTNAFSPSAFAQTSKLLKTTVDPLMAPKSTKSASSVVKMDHDAEIRTSIKDFTLLAFSSKRAGKKEVEASAHISLALIFDNQGNMKSAIEHYKQYHELCISLNDPVGRGLALNCIGVNCMLLAAPPSDAGVTASKLLTTPSSSSSSSSKSSEQYVLDAIDAHLKHLEVADVGGSFVAHTNLGLAYAMADNVASAAKHHQDALRVSIKLQSIYGQAISVGNLGQLAILKGDLTTARTCFEQHVQLIQALQDPEAEVNAWKLLANLSIKENNHSDAILSLEQAKNIASRTGIRSELRRIHCLIGESYAALGFADFAASLAPLA